MTLSTPITGGCQCGAVRYSVSVQLEKAHICHCRMCQKAAGNYFMPFATASRDAFEFSRGEPTWFHSCDPVKRGFCNRCGTPLVLDDTREEPIYIVLGSLDDPASTRRGPGLTSSLQQAAQIAAKTFLPARKERCWGSYS